MANVDNLKRQHSEISEIVYEIKRLIDISVDNNMAEIVKNINLLSGKIRIHLSFEDKFLYPQLLTSESIEVKKVANEYINEMGSISDDFANFKDEFNTRFKVMNNQKKFMEESQKILKSLENRMQKEDRYLYPLLSE
jgi:iron-sulfur cluster repair protein YtfE (RIC family)